MSLVYWIYISFANLTLAVSHSLLLLSARDYIGSRDFRFLAAQTNPEIILRTIHHYIITNMAAAMDDHHHHQQQQRLFGTKTHAVVCL